MTKTMDDVKADMSELYEQLKADQIEVKKASEMANVTGKLLKAEQLKLAREIYQANQRAVKVPLPSNVTLELSNA